MGYLRWAGVTGDTAASLAATAARLRRTRSACKIGGFRARDRVLNPTELNSAP
jgi:hypothetical protein